MAAKNKHGLDVYDLLLEIIYNLSPLQAEKLYSELLPRYTRRAKTHLYNENGEEDTNGKVRLLPYQYKAIRTKNGDTFMRRAFLELTNYIKFLEENQDTSSKYKAKLREYNSKTHVNLLSPDGWVYEKNKAYIISERPKVQVNPYLIEDFATAREYIKSIPKEIRDNAIDVQMLLMKFPELQDVVQDE